MYKIHFFIGNSVYTTITGKHPEGLNLWAKKYAKDNYRVDVVNFDPANTDFWNCNLSFNTFYFKEKEK